jgi:Tfp pilus assembly PilM family ATPase
MLSRFWKKKASMMVGIDIGTHAIKAVLLSEGPQGYILEDYAIETTPRGAVVDREIQDVEAVGKSSQKSIRTWILVSHLLQLLFQAKPSLQKRFIWMPR